MDGTAMPRWSANRWLVFGAASLPFFFVNFATFISLGFVLRPMIGEMNWSFAEAGTSFSVLGLACGLSSPLPAVTMKRYGGRLTLCVGAAFLTFGFVLASAVHGLYAFYCAMALIGMGFTFTGNVTGVYLISTVFEQKAGRLVGFYLMIGALGQALGPPIVQAIVDAEGWRGHWRAMAVVAAILGVLCFALVRNTVGPRTQSARDVQPASGAAGGWTVRQAALSYQFMLMAAAMAFTMTGITTLESIAVPHLAKLGASPQAAAMVLSVSALTATAVKGASGLLSEVISSARLVAIGLALQAAGDLLLIFAGTAPLQIGGALLFGAGWGLCIVAGTVGILSYFGSSVGSRVLSISALAITVGVTGPILAGAVGDRYGSFTLIFIGSIAILMAIAVPTFLMPRPVLRPAADAKPVTVAMPAGAV